jgi:hypothetical protein
LTVAARPVPISMRIAKEMVIIGTTILSLKHLILFYLLFQFLYLLDPIQLLGPFTFYSTGKDIHC